MGEGYEFVLFDTDGNEIDWIDPVYSVTEHDDYEDGSKLVVVEQVQDYAVTIEPGQHYEIRRMK